MTVTAKAHAEDRLAVHRRHHQRALDERAVFELSDQVLQALARGADAPTDAQVAHEFAQHTWAQIEQRAQQPTEFLWIAHPS